MRSETPPGMCYASEVRNSPVAGRVGPICALTTPGTCNYPRQFYDSADLGATGGREKTARQGWKYGRADARAFDLMTSAA